MSFALIPNLIIILCVVGILALFLRRLPEVVHEEGQMSLTSIIDLNHKSKTSKEHLQSIWVFLKRISVGWVKKLWHYMLEAKDLQQGQVLASRFAKMVSPSRKRVINIGVFNTLKKAERQIEQGQLEAAEQTYFEIIRKHPHEYAAYEGLLKIYTEQKNYEDIFEILEFLITHNPTNDLYHARLGNALLILRRYKEAIQAYTKAIELNSLIPARYINIGLAYKGLEDYENAKLFFQKGVDFEPKNVQYLLMLTDLLVKMDEKNQAVTKLEEYLSRDPNNKQVATKLAQIK
jgi:tetratricopeptide (TPR) repeat protein